MSDSDVSSGAKDQRFAEYLHSTLAKIRIAYIQNQWVAINPLFPHDFT